MQGIRYQVVPASSHIDAAESSGFPSAVGKSLRAKYSYLLRCGLLHVVYIGAPSSYVEKTRSDTPIGVSRSDLKSTYCFCAHMRETMKYFMFTEIHKQCLIEGSLRAIRCLDGALGLH